MRAKPRCPVNGMVARQGDGQAFPHGAHAGRPDRAVLDKYKRLDNHEFLMTVFGSAGKESQARQHHCGVRVRNHRAPYVCGATDL